MHAYLIILGIQPLTVGATYRSLPLHCTLVHWFWLAAGPEILTIKLKPVLANQPVVLTAQEELVFPAKTNDGTGSVRVNSIDTTPQLRTLHSQLCDLLDSMGAQYTEPQYVKAGYHPHVTHQKQGKLNAGDMHVSHEIYLIESSAPEHGNDRIVRAVFDLL